MIFRHPDLEASFAAAAVPVQVVARHLEMILMEHGIEPILYRLIMGATGNDSARRRLEIQCPPYQFTKAQIVDVIERMHEKYGMELIVAHRKHHDHIPERIIIELPLSWIEQPRVFLAKFGYIKGGNHG